MTKPSLFLEADDDLKDFTRKDVELLLANLDKLSDEEMLELEAITEVLEHREHAKKCQDDLLEFCKHMQEDYRVGTHHKLLADLLMDIEKGVKDRVTVSIAPRHGKSQLTSIFFTAWYLGKNPTHKVMLVSHTADLAVTFGRKVRNLIASDQYQEIFPGVSLAADSKSAGRWDTSAGGEFYATGVGSSIAGRGAHLLVVDDPHSEQDLLAGNFSAFEETYKWFSTGARTRLMKGGRVAVVACMVGSTQVLMGDGSSKSLKNIRPGDEVMSYNGSDIIAKKVLNWMNQGSDQIYTIALNNGNLIRANARHPFLVVREGVEIWVRLAGLKSGDNLVTLKGAQGELHKKPLQANAEFAKTEYCGTVKKKGSRRRRFIQNLVKLKGAKVLLARKARVVSAPPVYPESATIENTLTPPIEEWGTGGNGSEKLVGSTVAKSPFAQEVCASTTTVDNIGQTGRGGNQSTSLETPDLNIGTAYRLMTTSECGQSRGESVLSADSPRLKETFRKVGTEGLRWITAMTQNEFEPYCATFATSWWGTGQTKSDSKKGLSTYELTLSQVVDIFPSGYEDVFDIEIEDTENFIADGVVSHNTRWHQSDLIGKLIKQAAMNPEADQYEVVEFPAILNENTPEEKALWPEFFNLEALHRTRASMPLFQWNAQYQQNPTGETASIIKRDWWNEWPDEEPPECEYLIMTLDAAAELNNRADFTAIQVWGVFFNDKSDRHELILINAITERVEFPELKALTKREYDRWQPDAFIVEKKSSGVALYQELRRTGMSINEYTPARGTANSPNNKMARLNAVADMIKDGLVWAPQTRWAEAVVEEVASFPFGEHDDNVDCMIMALMRFRSGGFVRLSTDEPDEPQWFKGNRRGGYY